MLKIFLLVSGFLQILDRSTGVNSLQPVATYKTIVTEPRLAGEWTEGEQTVRFELVPDSKLLREEDGKERKLPLGESNEEVAFYSKAYLITLQQKGFSYLMLGSLSRIDGQLYMDITSLGIRRDKYPEQSSGFEFGNDYLPVYTIAKVGWAGNDQMTLQFLNGHFIKEQLDKGNMRLKHEQDNLFGSFLLTPSSFEWRQFLEKYGHDERLFNPKEVTILTRKR